MLSREELYDLVWAEPMTELGKRFDVSGSYLARICSLMRVPRPERGYWAKLAVGKAPPPTPLSPAEPGDSLHWNRTGEPVPAAKPKAPPRRKADEKVSIARNRTHGLIRGAKVHYEHGRPVDEGAYLKPYKKLLVDVTASEAGLDKALALANDLFNALDSVGHRVVIAPSDAQLIRERIDERENSPGPREYWQHGGLWSPFRPTVTYIGTVAVGLAIIEMSEQVLLRYVQGKYIRDRDYVPPRSRYPDHSWTTTRELPSGRMRLIAYAPYNRISWSKQWQETKSSSLRSQIRQIVAEIEAAAPKLVELLEEADRQAEIRRREWEEQEQRRRREEDRRRIEQSVTDSKTELGEVIDKWAGVMSVERFLSGVEESASALSFEERRDIAERLKLARQFLGTQDPLDFFRKWRTPLERYEPKYAEEARSVIVEQSDG